MIFKDLPQHKNHDAALHAARINKSDSSSPLPKFCQNYTLGKIPIFKDFQGPCANFQDFQGLEKVFSNSRTFSRTVETLFSCGKQGAKGPFRIV